MACPLLPAVAWVVKSPGRNSRRSSWRPGPRQIHGRRANARPLAQLVCSPFMAMRAMAADQGRRFHTDFQRYWGSAFLANGLAGSASPSIYLQRCRNSEKMPSCAEGLGVPTYGRTTQRRTSSCTVSRHAVDHRSRCVDRSDSELESLWSSARGTGAHSCRDHAPRDAVHGFPRARCSGTGWRRKHHHDCDSTGRSAPRRVVRAVTDC